EFRSLIWVYTTSNRGTPSCGAKWSYEDSIVSKNRTRGVRTMKLIYRVPLKAFKRHQIDIELDVYNVRFSE
ncbi:unnamed protein product, partial [Dovyalis caffra]